MFLNITNESSYDTLVTIRDGQGQVTETLIQTKDTCPVQAMSGDDPIDISFEDKLLTPKNKLSFIIRYIFFIFSRFGLLWARTGKQSPVVSKAPAFFDDTILSSIHTQIFTEQGCMEHVEIIYKEVEVLKEKYFKMGRIFSNDDRINVKYIINPIETIKLFNKWIRDVILVLSPILLFLVFFIIYLLLTDAVTSFIIVMSATFIALVLGIALTYKREKKVVERFIEEWNDKQSTK